jgi:hypothetical protein
MGAKLPSPPLVLFPAAPLKGIDKRKGQDKRGFRALGPGGVANGELSAFRILQQSERCHANHADSKLLGALPR